MNGIERAVMKAGGTNTALAKKVNVTPEAVRQWRVLGFVPQGNVFDVEDATGVPCFELNSTVYPLERFQRNLKQAS